MAYTAWSVVFGEQPTAAKWNQLGANDAGFKDGTNIDDNAIIARHIINGGVTAAKMGKMVACRVTKSSAQSIPNGTQTFVTFNTEEFDTDNMHDNSTNNHRIVAPTTGLYIATFNCRWDSSGSGRRFIDIEKNAASAGNGTTLARLNNPAAGTSNVTSMVTTGIVRLQANDYVSVGAFQDAGSAQDIVSTSPVHFSLIRIGDSV